MIKINVKYQNNLIDEVTLKGHSGYSYKGNDIVCAAVSSIVATTVNGILSINKTIKVKDDGNILTIKVIKDDNITNILLTNMIKLFQGIEKQYSKNVKVKKEGENLC